MTDIVRLVPRDATSQTDVKRLLESALQYAVDEDVRGIGVAFVGADGCTHTAFCVGDSVAALIGATERLKLRLLNA